MSSRSRQTWLLGGGALVLLAGAAVFTVYSMRAPADPLGLPPELSRENLQKTAAQDPRALRETMRQAMDRGDLSDEQRQELFRRMRELWEAQMDKRVDEYFNAPEAEKQAVLDRQIDEMQEAMKDREARRPPEGATSRPRPSFGNMTREERKSRAESRDPDRVARNMAYFSAMRARMAARGIEMPRGPGGGPGGGRGPRMGPP